MSTKREERRKFYLKKKRLIEQINDAKKQKENKWNRVKELELEILELEPNNISALFELVTIAKKKNNFEDLKKWQTKVLELMPNNIAALYDLISIAQREGNWVEVESFAKRVLEIRPKSETAKKVLNISIANQAKQRHEDEKNANDKDKKPFTIIETRELDLDSRTKVENERISEVRKQLYNGEITMSQLQELSEEFSNSLEGRILIAEICTYFKQSRLALQALKRYQSEHKDDMTEKEEKVMKKALEIVKSKQRIKDDLKWTSVYSKEK